MLEGLEAPEANEIHVSEYQASDELAEHGWLSNSDGQIAEDLRGGEDDCQSKQDRRDWIIMAARGHHR